MACDKRRKKGICGHNQCPYPGDSGYECVMILHSICECAGDCSVSCQYNVSQASMCDIVNVFESSPDTDGTSQWIAAYRNMEEALNNYDPFVHVTGHVHNPLWTKPHHFQQGQHEIR